MPQKSAIWVNVNAVLSISHTAVAFGIRGRLIRRSPAAARARLHQGGALERPNTLTDMGFWNLAGQGPLRHLFAVKAQDGHNVG